MDDYMKKPVIAVMMALCVLTLPFVSMARKTYSLKEIEAMKKAGKLVGNERFVIIRGNDSVALTGDRTEIPVLVPSSHDEGEPAPSAYPVAPAKPETPVSEPVVASPSAGGQGAVNVIPATPIDSKPLVAGLLAYDRIGNSRFLITMAREYYGNADFWPYIYEENKTKFEHPDKIKPGTTVLVPDLKKYGVDPKNPDDIMKARKLGREIYARYGKRL